LPMSQQPLDDLLIKHTPPIPPVAHIPDRRSRGVAIVWPPGPLRSPLRLGVSPLAVPLAGKVVTNPAAGAAPRQPYLRHPRSSASRPTVTKAPAGWTKRMQSSSTTPRRHLRSQKFRDRSAWSATSVYHLGKVFWGKKRPSISRPRFSRKPAPHRKLLSWPAPVLVLFRALLAIYAASCAFNRTPPSYPTPRHFNNGCDRRAKPLRHPLRILESAPPTSSPTRSPPLPELPHAGQGNAAFGSSNEDVHDLPIGTLRAHVQGIFASSSTVG